MPVADSLAKVETLLKNKLSASAKLCRKEFLQLEVDLIEQQQDITKFTAALQNMKLNRYCDVLPYTENVAWIEGSVHKGKRYVNASTLTVATGSDGRNASYIATQGPLKDTRTDFWRMVVQQRPCAIVMLTNFVERDIDKCSKYFAETEGLKKSFNSLVVKTVSQQQLSEDLKKRMLLVYNNSSSSSSSSSGTSHGTVTIPHYHYTEWSDHGVPTHPDTLLKLVEELHELQRDSSAGPILVHCSAGIGRSGVLCVVDIMTRRAQDLITKKQEDKGVADDDDSITEALDIKLLVAELREQRAGMVQTEEQYVFCHKALLHYCQRMAR
jgi:tyrosine-protein phosphatase non-receptor type 11